MRKIITSIVVLLAALYLLLMIPDSKPTFPTAEKTTAFAWNQDQFWEKLELIFKQARKAGCDRIDPYLDKNYTSLDSLNFLLENDIYNPSDSIFSVYEKLLFETAALTAACPEKIEQFSENYNRLRKEVKKQSIAWSEYDRKIVRDRIYRLLYGARFAFEEIMLQTGEHTDLELLELEDVPSLTPAAELLDVTLHSGDILASRGGAPTSALIARGSDYPGNFSHIAQVYIDQNTDSIFVIESHIEIGVAIASIEKYLEDKKLRIMVIRLCEDHPAVIDDPMLPHKAALNAYLRADSEHIPYDFAMNTDDPSKLFCSEVASSAYKQVGVELWQYNSHITSPGTRDWLSDFGVKNFTTQEPSDLEYDPQVKIVAEWRDYNTLLKDHLDNAVIDVMLEKADSGAHLDYNSFMLPIVRILKGYSMILNLFKKAGPVPEGMSATSALNNKYLSDLHEKIKTGLVLRIEQFKNDNGYHPPYWEIIKMARLSADESMI